MSAKFLNEVNPVLPPFEDNNIGSLQTKEEAAGKIRVFAMVDV
jgi:hypothetical protein